MDTYYCKQDYFEWCSCCEKLYSVINRTLHLKSKKHPPNLSISRKRKSKSESLSSKLLD